jgi:hypothetical protein
MNDSLCFQSISTMQIYLNSNNAELYLNGQSKSNIEFFFNEALEFDNHILESKISVVNAQFPCSFYLINSTNNQINITISGITTTFNFPYGNYNINTFITQWNTTVGTGWILSFNNITNTFNFRYTSNFIFSDSNINSIFYIIGFQSGNFYNSSSLLLTSSCCVNFGGIQRLNIKSSSFYVNNMDSKLNNVGKIICSVPVSSSQNGYIFYENYTNYKSIFTNKNIGSINLEITDENNNYVNFNNLDFNITFQIDLLREVLHDYKNLDDIYEIEKINNKIEK